VPPPRAGRKAWAAREAQRLQREAQRLHREAQRLQQEAERKALQKLVYRSERVARIQGMYYPDLLATVPVAALPVPPSVWFPATRAGKIHTASGPAGVQPGSGRCPACARGLMKFIGSLGWDGPSGSRRGRPSRENQ